ncbi:hypothetical protein [Ruminococcus sp. HUN007]|uniref:hypothetical protein n=1 Tax=Ruminococcus sp. HUN007 TaxID=1514668 RepID=UPI0005D236C3|nr:hypothetical protein [Ruminococcus sp. HUN007]
MQLFDEDGNPVGELFENAKDRVSDSFDESLGEGCLALLMMIIIHIPLILVLLLLWLLLKLLWIIVKFIFRLLWWLLRLPFCLIFKHEPPEF